MWVFERTLAGCRVWECELLPIAEKLWEELLPGALPTPEQRQSPWKPAPFTAFGTAAAVSVPRVWFLLSVSPLACDEGRSRRQPVGPWECASLR